MFARVRVCVLCVCVCMRVCVCVCFLVCACSCACAYVCCVYVCVCAAGLTEEAKAVIASMEHDVMTFVNQKDIVPRLLGPKLNGTWKLFFKSTNKVIVQPKKCIPKKNGENNNVVKLRPNTQGHLESGLEEHYTDE